MVIGRRLVDLDSRRVLGMQYDMSLSCGMNMWVHSWIGMSNENVWQTFSGGYPSSLKGVYHICDGAILLLSKIRFMPAKCILRLALYKQHAFGNGCVFKFLVWFPRIPTLYRHLRVNSGDVPCHNSMVIRQSVVIVPGFSLVGVINFKTFVAHVLPTIYNRFPPTS